MSQHQTLNKGDVVPAPWLDQIQEFISTMTGGMRLALANAQTVQIVGGTDNSQVSVGISGRWRYLRGGTSAGIGGQAPGTYDLYVTASDNHFSTGPSGEVDTTDYSFKLTSVAHGQTPPLVAGTVDLFRKIGEADFDGTNITALRQYTGAYDTTLPLTPTAPVGSIVPERVIGAAAQTAPLQTWEAGGKVVAAMDPTGRLTVAGFSSPSVWSPGDLKLSMQAGDHGARADGTFDWVLVAPGRRFSAASYAALYAALGSPPVDAGGTFPLPAFNDRALVAAGTAYPAGTAFGAATVALTADQLAHHYHSGTTANDSPDHSHSGVTGTENQNHAHSGTTAGDYPDHAHNTGISGGTSANTADGGGAYAPTGSWSGYSPGSSTPGGNFPRSGSVPSSSNFYHAHSFSGTWGSGGATARHQHDFGTSYENAAHNHNFGTGGASTRHSHTFASDGGTSWESGQPLGNAGQGHPNVPPSYAVSVFVKT